MSRAGLATVRDDRYTSLYQQWDTAGRQQCGDSWRSPGPLAGRHRVCEALNHPELRQRSNQDIAHGLAMLRAECAERARVGQSEPWRWYRKAWTPRVLSAACDIPDENAARARVGHGNKRTRQPSNWMDEAKAEIAAKERANGSN